jgi:hypothetical protein
MPLVSEPPSDFATTDVFGGLDACENAVCPRNSERISIIKVLIMIKFLSKSADVKRLNAEIFKRVKFDIGARV